MTASQYRCRCWCEADNPALRLLMCTQMSIDPGWPPDYAKSEDLAEWLGRPATIARWVAIDEDDKLVGHAGLGAMTPGPVAQLLCQALSCRVDQLAEICRIVVDPATRGGGVAGLLTRKAMRTAIERQQVPIATVLENRGSWLEMMLATGWRDLGAAPSRVRDVGLRVLAPPQRFSDIALGTSTNA